MLKQPLSQATSGLLYQDTLQNGYTSYVSVDNPIHPQRLEPLEQQHNQQQQTTTKL